MGARSSITLLPINFTFIRFRRLSDLDFLQRHLATDNPNITQVKVQKVVMENDQKISEIAKYAAKASN